MLYWDEMLEKYGFHDGEAVPPDAYARREAYVLTVNALAERFGSGVRAFAYDRPGMHNSCMILLCAAEQVADMEPAKLAAGSAEFPAEQEADDDDAFTAAVWAARELDVDAYVNVTVQFEEDDAAALLEAVSKVELPRV